MNNSQVYAIGTPGKPWEAAEKAAWLAQQTIKRSYHDEVVNKLARMNASLREDFTMVQYGALSYDASRYPLLAVKSSHWDAGKKTLLVTGGVHGYETSGVQGALRFLETKAQRYGHLFNLIIAPCISPWGYETINRWNPKAIDPNRSFYTDSPAEESAAFMRLLDELAVEIQGHIDLHETTDTDNSEFGLALAARDAKAPDIWAIPDGFYLVGESAKPAADFQQAIIASVEKVTHIAPPDEHGNIIGAPLQQWGVINYAARTLGLCMGLTEGQFVTTTEVYPDSERVDDENCIIAQVAAITGAFDFILNNVYTQATWKCRIQQVEKGLDPRH